MNHKIAYEEINYENSDYELDVWSSMNWMKKSGNSKRPYQKANSPWKMQGNGLRLSNSILSLRN